MLVKWTQVKSQGTGFFQTQPLPPPYGFLHAGQAAGPCDSHGPAHISGKNKNTRRISECFW